jgi:hypothetical protein
VLEERRDALGAGGRCHEVSGVGPLIVNSSPHAAARLTSAPDGRPRQGELLARHSADEPAAANFAARLEAAIHHDQLAPGCDVLVRASAASEDDAVPLEQTRATISTRRLRSTRIGHAHRHR